MLGLEVNKRNIPAASNTHQGSFTSTVMKPKKQGRNDTEKMH